jgi:tetratricopeptide (TPR) repeat protein
MSGQPDLDALVLEEALRLSREGSFSQADHLFGMILRSNEDDVLAHWAIGYEYLKRKLYHEATHCFERAIVLDPRCAPALGGLGRARLALGQWKEAETALRDRLQLGESANHYVYLAMALLRQSRYEEALSCCERALQLDKEQVDALVNQAFAYSWLGLHEQAVDSCRKAIGIDNTYDDAYVCLGVILGRANKGEEASEAFQHALELNPESASVYREFGLLQYQNGDLMLAESFLRHSIELDASSKEAHRYLRLVLRAKRKKGQEDTSR